MPFGLSRLLRRISNLQYRYQEQLSNYAWSAEKNPACKGLEIGDLFHGNVFANEILSSGKVIFVFSMERFDSKLRIKV